MREERAKASEGKREEIAETSVGKKEESAEASVGMREGSCEVDHWERVVPTKAPWQRREKEA